MEAKPKPLFWKWAYFLRGREWTRRWGVQHLTKCSFEHANKRKHKHPPRYPDTKRQIKSNKSVSELNLEACLNWKYSPIKRASDKGLIMHDENRQYIFFQFTSNYSLTRSYFNARRYRKEGKAPKLETMTYKLGNVLSHEALNSEHGD